MREIDRSGETGVLNLFADELDRRMAGVKNLLCHQTWRRRSIVGREVRDDVVNADLHITNNREMYSAIQRNGRTYNSLTQLPGAWASGDLVTILRVSRTALNEGMVRYESRVGAGGTREMGVTFERSRNADAWNVFVDSSPYPVAFTGTVWLSQDDGRLRSIEWKSMGVVLPARLNISQVSWTVNFSTVNVAGEAFVAPANAIYELRYRPEARRQDRTHSTFTRFRRFAGDARLLE